ncbi:hypothetical protein GUITHDRAFT_139471 [Guillardia theta CCMP2712]|uniref:AB hydrolase-1 domain-containing protein n=2 Tax=Guillardia theta TaxID=55529 RepID=L1J8I8_GUITC|nr:hypothetical protein GUITHDRAFT_139471 [Guillardia theta CCMP2712]EKX44858.1 hypothetical protein GUITHDRAFT_139471 [Guillardia theta CCMP2712]|eukprot:XP_005831838.1 hypothetical protein GUITHDRAFT_139471 [Guillardia theta CCMP2712]
MFIIRPSTDIYIVLMAFYLNFGGPHSAAASEFSMWGFLNRHRFFFIWIPFLWRLFQSFIHFLLSLAIIPAPLIYNEGPLLRFYPKWLQNSIAEPNAYREILRPRLESFGGISIQIVTPDGVLLDAMYFRGWNCRIDGPTIIRFNGNAEAIELQDPYLPQVYVQNGFNFVMFNYRGVGRSKWSSLYGNELAGHLYGLWRTPAIVGTHLDAWSLVEYVMKELRVDPSHVILLGHSIGGAIATKLAANFTTGPLTLCSSRSFASLVEVAVHLSPNYLGFHPSSWKARWLKKVARALLHAAGWEFNSVSNWHKVKGFKWIEYSGSDHIIPYDLSLHAALMASPTVKREQMRVLALLDDASVDNHNRVLYDDEFLQHLQYAKEACALSTVRDEV